MKYLLIFVALLSLVTAQSYQCTANCDAEFYNCQSVKTVDLCTNQSSYCKLTC